MDSWFASRNDKHIMHAETTKSFIRGFLLSVGLTLAAYFAVVNHLLSGVLLIIFIVTLAFAQLVVQLLFFLHMGRESKPHWNLMAFLVTFSVILIVILASIWIMNHLHYNLMSPEEMNRYIMEKEAIQK